MRRMSSPPSPSRWVTGLLPMAILGILICIGAALYSVAQTVLAIGNNSLLAAVTAAGLGVFFCGLVAALGYTLLPLAETHAQRSAEGTTVRIKPAVAWSYGIALSGGVVGSACYVAMLVRGTENLPFAAGNGGVTRYLMVALLVLSVVSLAALLRSREPGYLRLGTDGITHADMFRERSVRWEDIVDVTDQARRQARNPIVFVLQDGGHLVVANADRYGDSGAALYWMARHYWNHPESRDELTDGRALDRLRSAQFGTE